MNFEEYYRSSKSCLLPSEYDVAKIGWDACKKEVLNILQKHTIEHNGPHGTGHETLNIDCIDEIKKL